MSGVCFFFLNVAINVKSPLEPRRYIHAANGIQEGFKDNGQHGLSGLLDIDLDHLIFFVILALVNDTGRRRSLSGTEVHAAMCTTRKKIQLTYT